jgi:phospholipid/cholesterol/gamma-HCH transport system substrate-binding protein
VEVMVGATVLAALALLIGGVTWLKEIQLARTYRVWHVTFPQTGGLGAQDEVQVNGLRKGEVRSMRLVGDHVAVDLALAAEIQLTTDAHVAVRNVGLMGEKIIAVDLASTGRPLDSARDTVRGVFEKGIPEVMAQLGDAVGSIEALTAELRAVTDVLNKNGSLQASLRNFHDTSEELRLVVQENRAALRGTVRDFAAAARTARGLTADREAGLQRAVDDFVQAADRMNRLAGRLDSLRAQVSSLAGKLDRGEGTLGRLVNDDKLYTDLHGAVKEFQELVADVKAHPRKYLRFGLF